MITQLQALLVVATKLYDEQSDAEARASDDWCQSSKAQKTSKEAQGCYHVRQYCLTCTHACCIEGGREFENASCPLIRPVIEAHTSQVFLAPGESYRPTKPGPGGRTGPPAYEMVRILQYLEPETAWV